MKVLDSIFAVTSLEELKIFKKELENVGKNKRIIIRENEKKLELVKTKKSK